MPTRANPWLVLFVILAAQLPIVLDLTILHVAVPSITSALGASGNEVLWIIDTYSLIMAGLLVPMGTLADRLGYRRLLATGLTIFGLASLVAAFAPTVAWLIVARGLQAIGAAMIMPTVLGLIKRTFDDPKQLGIAFGIWTTVSAAGAAIGPLAGGFLLEHFWWGSIFLVNIPIMLLVIPLVMWVLPAEKPKSMQGWTISDALLLLGGMTLAVYTLKSAFKAGAQAEELAGLAMISIALLASFGWRQLRSPTPMLDMALFRHPAISVGVVMAIVASASIAGFELVLALELQYVLDKSPLQAGMFMLPFVLAIGLTGPIAGRLSDWIGLRPLASGSLLVAAAALYGLSTADLQGSYWMVAVYLGLLGAALATGLLASSIAIMGAAPADKAGAAGSLETTGFELGAGLGVTLFGVLLMSLYRNVLAEVMPGAPAEAFGSIGEAAAIAEHHPDGATILQGAKLAYSTAYGDVLLCVAVLMFVLALGVFIALQRPRTPQQHNHHA